MPRPRTNIWIAVLAAVAVFALLMPQDLFAPPLPQPQAGQQSPGIHKFLVEIDGITTASFDFVEGLESRVNVIEYRSGNSLGGPVKLAGLPEYSNIILGASVDKTGELWNWYKQVLSGQSARKNMVIVILDNSNNQLVRYTIRNAWPCAWHGPELHALENETARDVIEIAHEGFQREVLD